MAINRKLAKEIQASVQIADGMAYALSLFERVGTGIYIVQKHKFVYVNPFIEALTGYQHDELIGKVSLNFVSPEDMDKVKANAIENLKSKNIPVPYEYRFLTKNDEILWVMETVTSIEYLGQRAALGIMMDINNRKALENALSQSEKKYLEMIDNMEDLYYEIDLSGKFLFANASLCKFIGHTREELTGKGLLDFADVKNQEELTRLFMEVLETGTAQRGITVKSVSKDGSVRYQDTTVSIKNNERGEPIGWRCLARDVTEQKLALKALHESEEKLRAIFENSNDAIVLFSNTGSLEYNQHTLDMFGITDKEEVNKNIRDIMSPLKQPDGRLSAIASAKYIKDTFNRGSQHFEWTFRRANGEDFPAEISLSTFDYGGEKMILTTIRDISRRKLMEQALAQSEEKYKAIVEHMQDFYYEVDLTGNYLFVNEPMSRFLGYSSKELVGKNAMEVSNIADQEEAYKLFTGVLETGEPNKGSAIKTILKDGSVRYDDTSVSLKKNEHGETIGFCCLARDATDRKLAEDALRESDERYRILFNSYLDLIFIVYPSGQFIDANPAMLNLIGYSKKDLPDLNILTLLHPDDAQRATAMLRLQMSTDLSMQNQLVEFRFRRKDGTYANLEFTANTLNRISKDTQMQVFARDITQRKQLEQKLHEMATHDFLTGLPNRALLQDRFIMNKAQSTRHGHNLAIMSLDLDKFKHINDTYGHSTGDQVLVAVSKLLQSSIRASDTVARIGGDEFIILLTEVKQPEKVASAANNILNAFSKPLLINGLEFTVTTSIGIAVYPHDGDDFNTLLINSDAAMYKAKQEGRNKYKYFNSVNE